MQATHTLTRIIKRDGREEDFDSRKIYGAFLKAGTATGEFGEYTAQNLTDKLVRLLQQRTDDRYPTTEEVQDMIEDLLMLFFYKKTAKAFILSRVQKTAGCRG